MKKDFRTAFLILVIAQSLHSMEEVLFGFTRWVPVVTGNIHDHLGFIPVLYPNEQLFAAANIFVVSVFFIVCVFVSAGKGWAITTGKIISGIEVMNGLFHISLAIVFWHYSPGCISAFLLLTAGFAALLLPYDRRLNSSPEK